MDNESELKSMRTGLVGSWVIKASKYQGVYCVVLFNYVNYETYVNFFISHKDAQTFIECVVFEL